MTRKPRRAVVEVETVVLTCPSKRCNEIIPDPDHGSNFWDTAQFPGDEYITCPACGQLVTLPTRVHLLNLGA